VVLDVFSGLYIFQKRDDSGSLSEGFLVGWWGVKGAFTKLEGGVIDSYYFRGA
jgi:hypothetical protein